jgi:hypothetical protein
LSTRFYLPSTGAAAVSPTISGTDWTHINTDRRKMSPTKANSAFAATTFTPDSVDHIAAGQSHFVQFVSDVLAPQTIQAQTISLTVLNLEANAGNNCFINWKIYAVSVDGASVLGTLLARRADATEMGTTQIARTDSTTSTSFVGAVPFRLVFEIGIGGTPVATSQVQGHNGTIRFGDPTGGADLAANDTATTDLAPWLNFATDTLVFQTPVALSGTQAQSGTLGIQPSLTLTGTQDQAGTVTLSRSVALSGTQAQSGSVVGTYVPGSVTTPIALSGTQAQSGGLTRTPDTSLSGTQAQSGTLARPVSRSLVGTQAQAGSLGRAPTHLLSGTQPQVGSVARQPVAYTCSGTQAQSGSLGLGLGLSQTLSGSQVQNGSLALAPTHALAGTQAQLGSLSLIKGGTTPIALSGTQAQVGSLAILRATGLTLNGTQGQVGSFTMLQAIHLTGTQAQVGTLIRGPVTTLQGTQAQSGTLRMIPSAALTGEQAQIGILTRQVPGALTGTQAQAGSIVAGQGQTFLFTLSGTQAQVGNLGAVRQGPTQATTRARVVTMTGQAHAEHIASRLTITSPVVAGQATVQRSSTRAVIGPDDA